MKDGSQARFEDLSRVTLFPTFSLGTRDRSTRETPETIDLFFFDESGSNLRTRCVSGKESRR
jgi:hypothetical protein